jgi:hypothetical protein
VYRRAKESPLRMKQSAVAGFIATNPGTMLFKAASSKCQPVKATVPATAMATLDATGTCLKDAAGP